MSGFHVLVVDDNPDDRVLALHELRREWSNLTATEVYDETGLRAALEASQPDLVITDYHLRFSDGIEVLERVRARWPEVPVIMVTGTGTEEVAVEALQAGLDDYILKHHTARLGSAARKALRQRADARAARAALAESEERFRALANSSSLLIWISGADAEVIFFNLGWFAFRGRAAEQELGFGWLEGVHPDERDAAEAQMLAYEASRRPYTQRYRMLDANGEYRTVIDSASPRFAPDGAFLGYAGTTVDITDQLRAERKQLEAEMLLTTALDAAPVGLGFVDTELFYVRVNRTLAEFHRSTPDEHLGKRVGEILERLGVDVEAEYRRVLETGEAVSGVEVVVSADGETRRFNCSYHPVLLQGAIAGVGIVTVEITERERLEAQLLQAQKLEAVGRLAGGLAHDFNNLLSVIDGYASLIAETLSEDDERHGQALEISRASMRGAELTRRLLSFSRQQVLDERNIDLRHVIGELTAMLERLVADDVDLSFESGDEPAIVHADAGRLGQVIVNLVVNATEAISGGGRIALRLAVRGQSVVLEVEDTGGGIDERSQELLFEPFFTTKPHGTGLGLAMAHGLVQQARGQIEVASTVGIGTTFSVVLPRVDGGADDLEDAVAAREPFVSRPGGESVLVVEDSEPLRDLVRSVLGRAGFEVNVAEDGVQALEWIRANGPPAAVVADVEMPNMGGLQLAQHLEEFYPEVRILLVSGYAADDSILDLQTREFLSKPFVPAELARRLHLLLNH